MGNDKVSNTNSATSSATTRTGETSATSSTQSSESIDEPDSQDGATRASMRDDRPAVSSAAEFNQLIHGDDGPVDNADELRHRHSEVWSNVDEALSADDLSFDHIRADHTDSSGRFPGLGGEVRLGFEEMDAEQYSRLLENTYALKQAIGETLSENFPDKSPEAIEQKADMLVEEAKADFTREVRSEIGDRAVENFEASQTTLETINRSSESRRGFLAQLAAETGDADTIEATLSQYGITDNTGEIADICAEAHEKGRVDALASGEPGRDRYSGWSNGQFAEAEGMLREELATSISDLDALIDQVDNASVENSAVPGPLAEDGDVLTSSDFELARDAVLGELGMDGVVEGTNFDNRGAGSEIILEEIQEAEETAETRDTISSGISIGAAVVTAPVGGAAGTALTAAGVAENGMNVLNSWRESRRTEVAAAAGTADRDAVDAADAESAGEVAAGIASTGLSLVSEGLHDESARAIIDMVYEAESVAISDHIVRPDAERAHRRRNQDADDLQSTIDDKIRTSNLQK